MTTAVAEKTPAEIKRDLAHFNGSGVFHQINPFIDLVIGTDGIKYVATEMNACWLVTDIATTAFYLALYIKGMSSRNDLENSSIVTHLATREELTAELLQMQFWTLEVKEDRTAVVECRADSGRPVAVRMEYTFTDFPLDEFRIWVANNGQGMTLLLPSEY